MSRAAADHRGWIAASLGLVLSACSAPVVPFEITVRDAASDEPIAGATVIAQTLHHYHPMAIADIITSSWRGSFSESLTDEHGSATVTASATRPMRVLAIAPGRGLQIWLFDPPPDDSGWASPIEPAELPMVLRIARPAAQATGR